MSSNDFEAENFHSLLTLLKGFHENETDWKIAQVIFSSSDILSLPLSLSLSPSALLKSFSYVSM